MDNPFGGQIKCRRDFGLPRFAAAQGAASLQQARPRGAVYGAVHPAAAQQRAVGRVDNGVRFQGGDISLQGYKTGHAFIIAILSGPKSPVSLGLWALVAFFV